MKMILSHTLLFLAVGVWLPNATAQAIEVPDGSDTNSLTLGKDEWAEEFSFPIRPDGLIEVSETPGISTSFAGTTNNAYYPPDTMGAVGTNRLMIMINGEVRIQDRSGNLISTITLNNFWSGAGSYNDTAGHYVFDPHVIYDPYNNRWIAVAVANPQSSVYYAQLLIGVSATGDPGGMWYQYAYNVDNTAQYWADYPQFGFNKDKVVINFRYASVATGALDTTRTGLWVFDKNVLYSGATPTGTAGDLSSSTYGFYLQPAHTYDTNISAEYMVQSANPNSGGHGLVRLYAITGSPTNAAISTIGTVQASPWVGKFSSDTASSLSDLENSTL